MANISFSCEFVKDAKGTVVIKSADNAYYKIIGRNGAGKSVYAVFNNKYADFISALFDDAAATGKIYTYIRESADGNMWRTDAVSENGKLKCSGRLIEDCSVFAEHFHDDGDSGFVGAIIAVNRNGVYYTETYSDEILKLAPAVGIVSLEAAAEEYFFGGYSLLGKCSELRRPMSVCMPSKSGKIYRTDIIPVSNGEGGRIVLNIYRYDNNFREFRDAAFCVLSNDGNGKIYIKRMNGAMADMLAEMKVLYFDICSPELFLKDNCGGEVKKILDGCGGKPYTLRAYPAADGDIFAVINNAPPAAVREELTVRENEILSLAARGCTNRYIAHVLGITEGTVKKIAHNGFVKLGISSRVELVKLYLEKNP